MKGRMVFSRDKKKRKKGKKFIKLRREKGEGRKERYFKKERKKLLNDHITVNKFLQRDIFFSNLFVIHNPR